MKKEMLELLAEKINLKNKNAEEILELSIEEIANAVKELGHENTKYLPRNEIESILKTKYIGKELYCFKAVKSTNTVAKFLAEYGVSEGTVIISETQTRGRGRSGKKWESPVGGIWLSIILDPDVSLAKAPLLTLAAGVAVTKTLKSFGIASEIKWTNDILIQDKKVCGILTESIAKLNSIDHVIVGVGINADLNISNLPYEIQEGSISLNEVANDQVNKIKGIAKFLEEFENIYEIFKKEDFEYIFKEWRDHSHTIGKYVEIKQPFGKVISGYAVGINQEGALILEQRDGKLVKILSGECRVIE